MPSPADVTAGGNYNTGISSASGYLTPAQLLSTPQGMGWLDKLYQQYYGNMNAGVAGYGMPQTVYTASDGTQSRYADPTDLRGAMASVLTNPSLDPQLYDWMMKQGGGLPQVQTVQQQQLNLTSKMADDANKLAADLAEKERQARMAEIEAQGRIQAQLQAGQISSNEAIAAQNRASQERIAQMDVNYRYAELAWQKEYGAQNLQILRDQTQIQRDRLGLDRETSLWQKANDERRVAVEEGRLGIEKDKFGLDKQMQEAQLRANPFNAVANALYSRGANVPGGTNEFGQPTTTLDNSGQLPFLQQLMSGQQVSQIGNPSGGMYLNQGGIGGNTAPRPTQISQQSLGNMSGVEQGITTSLAQYGGWDPNDYWKKVQNSWNTAGQHSQNFGNTRLA